MATRGDEGKALDELRASEQKLTKLVQVRAGGRCRDRGREREIISLRVSRAKGERAPSPARAVGTARELRLSALFYSDQKLSVAPSAAVEERNSNGRAFGPAFSLFALSLAASKSSHIVESSLKSLCRRGKQKEKSCKRRANGDKEKR